MGEKFDKILQNLDKKYGKCKLPSYLPPPASADMDAALEVAMKNSELVAGVILGLHGPPQEGADAAHKLMNHYVDWNEVRVANPELVTKAMGRTPRALERTALMLRFLEAFFLRQRNMNLEYVVGLKPSDQKAFFSNLEVFSRDELAALLLTGFGHPLFPPSEHLLKASIQCGVVKQRTTALQMAKEIGKKLDPEQLLNLYHQLMSVELKETGEED